MTRSTSGEIDLAGVLGRIRGLAILGDPSERRADFTFDGLKGSCRMRARDGIVWQIQVEAVRVEDSPWLRRWMARHNEDAPQFRVRLRSAGTTHVLAVVTDIKREVPSIKLFRDGIRGCAELAHVVQFLVAHPPEVDEWGQFHSGFEDMVLTLAHAGIPAPPIPEALKGHVVKLAPWCWATYEVDGKALYLDDLRPAGTNRFACAHLGHGFNSYFMCLEVVWAGTRLGGRVPYGGAFTDPVGSRQEVAAAWMAWQRDLDLLEGWEPAARPGAAARKRLGKRSAGDVLRVPPPGSPWPMVQEFALSYNAYDRNGDFDSAAAIGNSVLETWEAEESLPDDLHLLRTALFFEQRRWRHFGYEPDVGASRYIDALLAAIIYKTGGTLDGPPDALP